MSYLLGLSPRAYTPAAHGVVAFMGGDFWHALWLARKTGYRRLAYVILPTGMTRHFDTVCVPTLQVRDILAGKGTPQERIRIVGNLMVDGIRSDLSRDQLRRTLELPGDSLTLGLLPGSRLYHVRESLPAYLKITDDIQAALPGTRFLLGLSPFISLEALDRCLIEARPPSIPGTTGRLVREADGSLPSICTAAGTEVKVLPARQYEVMLAADLILTIPGTNTAEVACMGTPMIVTSTGGARVPRGGLGWLMGGLPLGRGMRKRSAAQVLRRFRFSALPNQVAERMLVPEVYVEKSADEVTVVALELLKDQARRKTISAQLHGLMGEPGAADRVKDEILALLGTSGSSSPGR